MKTILFTLICLTTLLSLFCGLLMVSDPTGHALMLPFGILVSTPFQNFFIPGILLTIIVGVPGLLTIFYYLQDSPQKYDLSVVTGVSVSLWIVGQVIWTRTIHWQDFIIFFAGMLIILFAYQLKGKWIV